MIETLFHITGIAAFCLYVFAWGRNVIRDRQEYRDEG